MKVKLEYIIIVVALIFDIFLIARGAANDINTRVRPIFSTRIDNDWNIERIESSLGVHVPHEAQNLAYEGEYGRLTVLDLRFTAPSQIIDDFISHFCYGALYPHYDPFNSIDVLHPVKYPYEIKLFMSWGSYYSYSPHATDTILGTRCIREGGPTLIQIRVDKSDPEVYEIRLEYNIGGGFGLESALSGSPFVSRGIVLNDGEYVINLGFCLDVDPFRFGDANDIYAGAKVHLGMSGQNLPDAFISPDGYLISGDPSSYEPSDNANTLFSNCYDARSLEPGLHNLDIALVNEPNIDQNYTWSFRVKQ